MAGETKAFGSPLTGPSDGRPWAALVGPGDERQTVALVARLFDLLGYQVCDLLSAGDPLTFSGTGLVVDLDTLQRCDVVVLLPLWGEYTHARWLVLSALLTERKFRDAMGVPITPPLMRLDLVDDMVRRLAPESDQQPERVTVAGVDISPEPLQLDGRPWAPSHDGSGVDYKTIIETRAAEALGPYAKLADDLAGVDYAPFLASQRLDLVAVRKLAAQIKELQQYGAGSPVMTSRDRRYLLASDVFDLLERYGV